MMCSTWKISVFGIVALMLAFGLTAGDAFAHSDGHSTHASAPRAVNHFDDATLTVTVNSSTDDVEDENGVLLNNGYGGGYIDRTGVDLLGILDADMLRATEVLDNIVFTYTPGRTTTKEKNIVLSIPGGWTRPERDNDDGVHEPGEVEISSGTVSISGGRGGGWRVTSSNYDPAPTAEDSIVITYKRVTVPKRASIYKFGFVSNVVGGGHTNELDGHLLAHAQSVDEGGHMHRDSSLSVEAHTHTSSGIAEETFTITVHTHSEDGGIAPIVAHEHRLTPSTTDDDDLTEVHKPAEHAHDGDGGDVIAVFEHTHIDGDNSTPNVEDPHRHDGDGKDVSLAPSHSHAAEDDASVSVTNAHTHSSASSENAEIPAHAHTGADAENAVVEHHTHPESGDSSSSAPDHEHSAVDEDFSRVSDHTHDSATHSLDLDTVDLGPDHTHYNRDGAFPPAMGDEADEVAAHTHDRTDTADTGNPKGNDDAADDDDDIPDHAHTKSGGTASKVGTRTALAGDVDADGTIGIASHVHSSPTGSVVRPKNHTHADGTAASTEGSDFLHVHTDANTGVGHVINSHNHTTGDAPDPRHEHKYYSGRRNSLSEPKPHMHDAETSPAGNPRHSHATSLTGAVQGPYESSHTHSDGGTPEEFSANGGDTDEAPFHAHKNYSDEDSPVVAIDAHSHTAVADSVSGPSSDDGHTHSALAGDDDSILEAAVHKHVRGIANAAPLHTHATDGGIEEVGTHDHGTGFADNGGDSADLAPHNHVGADKGPIITVEEHKHTGIADRKGDPAHSHTEDYAAVAGADDEHTHDDHETGSGPVSHSHAEGYVSIDEVGVHTHATADSGAGSPVHSHDSGFDEVDVVDDSHEHTAEDDGIAETDGLDHEHATATGGGAVKVPRVHTHYDSVGNPNHVVQSEPHVHAYDDGSYIMDVGPAYSGSGMLTFSNTGTPRLMPEKAEDSPYKDKHLVTKGQSLGDLMLTYTAAGTMVKGAGIRIFTDELPIDQGFYEYNRAGGPGGAVTLETRNADFDEDPVNSDTDGFSENALYVKTTRALEAGNQVTFRVQNLKFKEHGKDEDGKDPKLDVTDYMIEAYSASPLVMPMPTDTFLADDLKLAGGAPIITVTAAHKTGETKLKGRDPQEDLAFATAEEGLKTLTFEYKSGVPMAIGSQVEIEIPNGWSQPFEATSSSDERAGAVTLTGMADLRVDGMVLRATTIAELEGDPAPMLLFDYKGIKAPAVQDLYQFVTRTSAGPHARALEQLGAIDVDVTGSHAAGTVKLMRGSSVLRQVDKGQSLGNLRFVYEAAGRMAKGAQVQITVPLNWTSAHPETKDGRDAPGEVSISSGNAELEVTGGGGRPWKLTATTTASLVAGNTIVFNYKAVTAPSTSGSYTFVTHATSFSGALSIDNVGARLESSPTVGVDQAPDGAGTVVLTSTAIDDLGQDSAGAYLVDAGESLGNLVFTFTADGSMESGSVVTLTIPGTAADWPDPTPDDGDTTASAGEVTAGGAGVVSAPSIVDRTITVDISADLVSGNTFTITYKKVSAPTTVDEYDFIMTSKSTTGGDPEALTAGSPSIKVGPVRVGELTITRSVDGVDTPLTTVEPGEAVGDITLTFEATSRMSSGAQVIIDVPDGWSPPSEDNGDTTDDEGEVALTSGAAAHEVRAGKIVATTNADLASGDTLVFTYKGVVAQATPGSASFTTLASISTTGIPVEIAQQPAPISVRVMVTDIAIDADDSFFAGDDLTGEVTLWAGASAASAAADMMIYLSTSSMTGSFADADGNPIMSITIAAGMNGAAFTYNDTAPGTVTLTASDMMPAADDAPDTADTSTALMATHVVTVKSGVAGLVVDPVLVKAGSDITVTATGKAGGGTVQVMDSDGMPVGATKALDPVGDADADGNQAYTRTVSLPAELADGTYKVTVSIQGLVDRMNIEVLNDQSAPTLSEESAWPGVVANGGQAALRVSVAQNESMIEIASVTADVSALDSTRTDPIALSEQPDEEGVYTRLFTISTDNTNADGEVMVSFTATDSVGNKSEPATASITLKNDVTAPMLSMESAMPSTASDGSVVTISVSTESGATVKADASAIGGAADLALDEGMDADMMGTGMYSGMVTVTGAADGEQTITITATDASTNSSEAMATVMIDNTGPMLSMASADPAMATNGSMVTISVSTESGATVMADASAIGGDAAMALAEGMDENMAGTGMYSADVTVADDAMDGEHMVSISASDALGNAGEAVSLMVTVDNTAPTLADAAVTPDWALNGDTVKISVSTESGATVMADASAIGGDAATALAEGMDADMAGTGMYSADVTVTGAMGGDQMVSISASDAHGNASEAVSASVSIHVVTSASFSPADVSTGDTVMVSAMGTAGLTATFNVSDAEGTNIVTEGMLTESADAAGSYSGSFDVVVDAHPTGTYWVSVNVGRASMTAAGALTIDHLAQFDLMIGAGTHLIHVPLDVTQIDGVAGTIDTVGDLYDALGDAVNFIISLSADGSWNSYLGDSSAGGVADAAIGDDTGLIAVMSSAATLQLAGNALGTGGTATISLSAGNNLVGVPLDGDPSLNMISDALASPAITAVVVSNAAGNGFNIIKRAGDPGDGAIMGGVGYIVVSAAMGSVPVVGMAWDNSGMMEDASATVAMNGGTAANGNGASTAPSIGFQTPVLQVQGKLIDQAGMMSREGLNVTVKNLTSGGVLGRTTATDDYSMTFVKLDSSAAKVGDVIEIKADSPNPLLGIRPVQHVVTAEDVLDSRISLPDLVTYEIPAQTELLANYPNPFNPETWIPYRLAEDARVSLTIYGASGSLVRTIDIGFTPAAVYQGRSEAIYWDGRNDFGEQVSSGIYFYHLNAGDFSATRKMVIVK